MSEESSREIGRAETIRKGLSSVAPAGTYLILDLMVVWYDAPKPTIDLIYHVRKVLFHKL